MRSDNLIIIKKTASDLRLRQGKVYPFTEKELDLEIERDNVFTFNEKELDLEIERDDYMFIYEDNDLDLVDNSNNTCKPSNSNNNGFDNVININGVIFEKTYPKEYIDGLLVISTDIVKVGMSLLVYDFSLNVYNEKGDLIKKNQKSILKFSGMNKDNCSFEINTGNGLIGILVSGKKFASIFETNEFFKNCFYIKNNLGCVYLVNVKNYKPIENKWLVKNGVNTIRLYEKGDKIFVNKDSKFYNEYIKNIESIDDLLKILSEIIDSTNKPSNNLNLFSSNLTSSIKDNDNKNEKSETDKVNYIGYVGDVFYHPLIQPNAFSSYPKTNINRKLLTIHKINLYSAQTMGVLLTFAYASVVNKLVNCKNLIILLKHSDDEFITMLQKYLCNIFYNVNFILNQKHIKLGDVPIYINKFDLETIRKCKTNIFVKYETNCEKLLNSDDNYVIVDCKDIDLSKDELKILMKNTDYGVDFINFTVNNWKKIYMDNEFDIKTLTIRENYDNVIQLTIKILERFLNVVLDDLSFMCLNYFIDRQVERDLNNKNQNLFDAHQTNF